MRLRPLLRDPAAAYPQYECEGPTTGAPEAHTQAIAS